MFSLWPTTFVAQFTAVTAAFLNKVRVDLSRAIDGTAGGLYTPSPAVEIGGDGLEVSGPAVLSGASTISLADVTLSGTNKLKLASRSITRMLPLVGTAGDAPTTWTQPGTNANISNLLTGGGIFAIPLDLPHGQVLQTIEIDYDGAGGHTALPDQFMPRIQLFRVAFTGTETAITGGVAPNDGIDPSLSTAALEVDHAITLGSLAHTIDRATYSYVLYVTGESGTGTTYKTGGRFRGLRVTCTCTSMSEY